jgi:hypothetical protein
VLGRAAGTLLSGNNTRNGYIGETFAELLAPGKTVTFTAQVQNDSSLTQRLRVFFADSARTGVTSTVKKGITDITSTIKAMSTGYLTAPLAPGTSETLSVIAKAGSSAKPGQWQGQLSVDDGTGRTVGDFIYLVAEVPGALTGGSGTGGLDLLVRQGSTGFIGGNLKQSDYAAFPTLRSGAVVKGTAVSAFTVRVQNDAKTAQAFTLTATSADCGAGSFTYTAKYATASILAALTGSGWKTPVIQAGKSIDIPVTVHRNSSSTGTGAMFQITDTVTDAVVMVTNVLT